MKKIIAIILSVIMLFTGCSSKSQSAENTDSNVKQVSTESAGLQSESIAEEQNDESEILQDSIPQFSGLDDPKLLTYVSNNINANLEYLFASDDFIIEKVDAIYLSDEYIEELTYNSKSNVFFGYSLEELDKLFQGDRYIFTLGDNGQTEVRKMETFYDDSTERVLKNVAVGGGVILVCVTVSIVTAGAGIPTISMIFATSAKTATSYALSSGVISGAASAITTAYQTHDIEQALDAGVLAASEGFKWGAIIGALSGGLSKANELRKASKAAESQKLPRDWRQSEKAALEEYGGREQVSFLGGKEVPRSTPGATRPDIVREVGGKLEAIEVKNYDLATQANRNELYSEIKREISERIANLPEGSTQRIVLDIKNKGYPDELVKEVMEHIWQVLEEIYPNIPIDLI